VQPSIQLALVVLLLLLLAVLECGACNVSLTLKRDRCTSRSLALDTATCAVKVITQAQAQSTSALMRLAVT
jgi:hypothetical protein